MAQRDPPQLVVCGIPLREFRRAFCCSFTRAVHRPNQVGETAVGSPRFEMRGLGGPGEGSREEEPGALRGGVGGKQVPFTAGLSLCVKKRPQMFQI